MRQVWIKLHRDIIDWEWYDEPRVFRVFLHCILKANHKDNNWRGEMIKKGSFVTSLQHLADQTHLSVQNIRTILNKLKSTKEIVIKSTNKNTIIAVCKYSTYQEDSDNSNKQLTNHQQTTNKQLTTNKNGKNVKNDKKKDITRTNFIKPTKQELADYCKEKGYTVNIDKYLNHYESNGWKVGKNKMVSWRHSLANWNINEIQPKTKAVTPSAYIYKCPNCSKSYRFKEKRDYHHRCTENKCQEIPRGDGLTGYLLEFDKITLDNDK